MRASYRTSCQPFRLRDRVAVCCDALLKLYYGNRFGVMQRRRLAYDCAVVVDALAMAMDE